MGVAFFLGFIILMIIATLMLISLITGIILLIAGNIKKKKYQSKGEKKKTSKIMISLGTIMTATPIIIVIIFCALGGLASLEEDRREKYFLANAVTNEDYELLKQLLEEGVPADSNDYKLIGGNFVSDGGYATPLWMACSAGNYEMVKLLLEYGADPDREGPNRSTSVEQTISNGHYDILELLLSNGADPNYKNYAGNIYLVSACRTGDVKAVELFLKYGADPNVTDSNGVKLLEYENTRYKYIPEYNTPPADEEDCLAIINLLKAYGAEK